MSELNHINSNNDPGQDISRDQEDSNAGAFPRLKNGMQLNNMLSELFRTDRSCIRLPRENGPSNSSVGGVVTSQHGGENLSVFRTEDDPMIHTDAILRKIQVTCVVKHHGRSYHSYTCNHVCPNAHRIITSMRSPSQRALSSVICILLLTLTSSCLHVENLREGGF